jgi:hypothetical protein
VFVLPGYALDGIDRAGNAHADGEHPAMIVGFDFKNGIFNLFQDMLDGISFRNGVVKLFKRFLGKIHRGGHDVAGLKIHADEASPLGVETQGGRGPAKLAPDAFALRQETFFDQMVHINADGGRSQVQTAGELDARQTFLRADATKQISLEMRDSLMFDFESARTAPRGPSLPGSLIRQEIITLSFHAFSK